MAAQTAYFGIFDGYAFLFSDPSDLWVYLCLDSNPSYHT